MQQWRIKNDARRADDASINKNRAAGIETLTADSVDYKASPERASRCKSLPWPAIYCESEAKAGSVVRTELRRKLGR